jgi:hypothetical protein
MENVLKFTPRNETHCRKYITQHSMIKLILVAHSTCIKF